jgi:hypothetical protein
MAKILDPRVIDVVRRLATKAGPAAGGAGVLVDSAEDALQKQEEAERAKTSPIAKANPQTITKDCTEDKKCEECPPDHGAFWQRSFTVRQPWVDYQIRICSMPSGPNFVLEWNWMNVKFDGFDSSECLLKEAKGRYDQFFTRFGARQQWWREGEEEVIAEAMIQGAVARPRPPVVLKWYFMEPISFRYFSRIIQAAYPDIEVLFRP